MADNSPDLRHKIRDILLTEWDPIGVSAIPEAKDEYDGYILDIASMLASKKSVDEICSYLLWAEAEHMGLSADRQKANLVAAKLSALSI